MSDDMTTAVGTDGEQSTFESVEADVLNLHSSAVARATAGELNATNSAVGIVTSSAGASFRRAGAGVLAVTGDVTVDQGGAALVLSEGGVSVTQGFVETVLSGGDVTFDRAGAGIVVGRSVDVKSGWVGVVAASDTQIAEGANIVFGKPASLAIGAIIGIVVGALLGLIISAESREG